MPDSELAVVAAQIFPVPILIERAGPSTKKKFFEFFTVPIRNANTRAAYYRAIQQFLAWSERAGYRDIHTHRPPRSRSAWGPSRAEGFARGHGPIDIDVIPYQQCQ